jgi:nucleotide-binding universal stress UspA family protein
VSGAPGKHLPSVPGLWCDANRCSAAILSLGCGKLGNFLAALVRVEIVIRAIRLVLVFMGWSWRQSREHRMYKKVLLAYDGSIEGRRALREGAKLAQLCDAEVFLLAVVEPASSVATLEGGLAIPIDEQIANYKTILAEGVERLKALGFSPTARLGMGAAGQEIAEVAEEIGANLVVVGHRPTGPLARWWFGSVGTYLVKHLRCSVLVAQTEISDDQFAKLTVAAAQA